jgi:polygalacturonase
MTSVTVVDSKQRRLTLAQNRIRLLASGARGPIGFDLLGDPADWTGKVPQFTGTGRQAVPVLPGSGADATLRADLLSNTGTANVKHKLSGTTGAVAQTLDAIVNEIITPTRWGAVGDGSTDCTAAFNAAIADANARLYGATLVIPAVGSAWQARSTRSAIMSRSSGSRMAVHCCRSSMTDRRLHGPATAAASKISGSNTPMIPIRRPWSR